VWQPAYIGIGSNEQDPQAQVRQALGRLDAIPGTCCVLASPLYGSRPLGTTAQPDFVNAVAGILTQLTPEALLEALKSVERLMGRAAVHEKWGPRVIDLDLLVHGEERRDSPAFTLPHPGIVERNFVLYPLAAIAPDLEVPGVGRVALLRDRIGAEGLWRL
jgi:2-amino-4-hydroxy-6-hydroxymethyldihydropteridine diphosphokinase